MNETKGAKSPILLPALLALVGLVALAIGVWWMLSAPGRDTERIQAALNADLPLRVKVS